MIKNILTVAIISIAISGFSQETKKVLFIGNSYTYVNNLPELVFNIAKSNGDSLIYDSSTPGGYNFNSHTTNATTLSKIQLMDWDFVTLQSQSQEPAFPPSQVATDVYPYAKILVDSIKSNNLCTEPLFFMTWGRKYGDQSNCASYPPICTYAGMQQRLRESYLEMGQTNHASVSPVGMAWKHSIDSIPTLDLYSSDNSHPSLKGSYLSACVFYAMIFDKSPLGINFHSTLEPDTAEYLQYIAHHTVFDSLNLWKHTDLIPTSDFNHSNSGYNFTFTNTSTDAREYFWTFGDGSNSIEQNPNHTFASDGTYIVTLNAISVTCDTTIFIDTLDIALLNNTVFVLENNIKIYPNPASTYVQVESGNLKVESYAIYDVSGRNLTVTNPIRFSKSDRIDISNLQKGIYFIKLQTDEGRFVNRFVKQ